MGSGATSATNPRPHITHGMNDTPKTVPYPFLTGGGEMGALTRAFDWSQTPIGSPDNWPHSLRTTVSILLSSRFPMLLFWGPERIQFYNDAFRPSTLR